ncbi:MAG: DUF308 domain-containing protein [Thermoleophilia bacterium]|nr:DUF308 domain-containing protein [Thermoleophilia bacterium]
METESEVNAEVAASSGLFKGVGITLIILGIVAILFPLFTSYVVVGFAGWVLVIASFFIFGSAFLVHGAGGLIVRILWALVALIAGIILLTNTDGSVEFLTAVLAIYFILMGVVKIAVAASQRGTEGAGWVAVNGVLSLIIGLIIIADLDNTKDWAIGLLLGIDFIFAGFVLLMAGSAAKQLGQDS